MRPASRRQPGGAAGDPLHRRAHRIARVVLADRVEQRRRSAGAPDQNLRIGQHDGSSHEPCTMNGRSKPPPVVGASRRGGAGEVERPRRDRCRARNGELHRRSLDRDILHRHRAVRDVESDRDAVIGRAAGAQFVAAGQRTALQTAQQLLDIDAGQRAVRAGYGGGACRACALPPSHCRPSLRAPARHCLCLRAG